MGGAVAVDRVRGTTLIEEIKTQGGFLWGFYYSVRGTTLIEEIKTIKTPTVAYGCLGPVRGTTLIEEIKTHGTSLATGRLNECGELL